MKGIFNFGRDQSIVVNGESGAGKTETIKLLLSHITEMSDGQALNEVSFHLKKYFQAHTQVAVRSAGAEDQRSPGELRECSHCAQRQLLALRYAL